MLGWSPIRVAVIVIEMCHLEGSRFLSRVPIAPDTVVRVYNLAKCCIQSSYDLCRSSIHYRIEVECVIRVDDQSR